MALLGGGDDALINLAKQAIAIMRNQMIGCVAKAPRHNPAKPFDPRPTLQMLRQGDHGVRGFQCNPILDEQKAGWIVGVDIVIPGSARPLFD